MFFTVQLLFFFAVIRPVQALQLKLVSWQCGHTLELRNLTYTTTVHECPQEAIYWNHCCVKHDECYVRQSGQEYCDLEFDICINTVNRQMNSSSTCSFYSTLASIMIKAVGGPSYKESVNYTEPLELVRHQPSDVSIPYRKVYEDCPLVNATLSSCALKFNYCSRLGVSTDGCRDELCECMREAGRMDNVTICMDRVESVCQRPSPSDFDQSRWWYEELDQLSVWLLYVMAFLIVVISCRYGCLWWRSRGESQTTTAYTTLAV